MSTFARLFDPTQQFQLNGGQLNVAGQLKVYYDGTDDMAPVYDEYGTQLQQPEILDSNGRCRGLFVDSERVYRLEVYDQFGSLIFTVAKMSPCGGGSIGNLYDVTSSDLSVNVAKYDNGGVTTFDLSTNVNDSTDLLEWFASIGSYHVPNTDVYRPSCISGNMEIGDLGVLVLADAYYHITAHVLATKNEEREPYYDKVNVKIQLRDILTNTTTVVCNSAVIVDYSLGLSEEFEVSTDVKVDRASELYITIENQDVDGGSFELKNTKIHRVYSGAPHLPGGVQEKLVAGRNITIVGNVISATGGGGGGGGSTYTAGEGINISNDEISVDTSVIQEKLTAGNHINIQSNVISAELVQSDWNESNPSSPSYIKNKPNDQGTQVQSDWTETDNGDPSYIKHKPTLASVATSGDYLDLTNRPSIPPAQVQSDWGQTISTEVDYIKNKPTLANVAISGSYTDLTNKPTIPAAQVNADWTSNSGVSQILNKPTLAAVATSGDYSDLTNKPTIPAAQVNSDWTSNSGVSQILNKPNLAAVATSGSYTDLSNKPSIPAAQVQSDWSQSDSSSVDFIKNKPSLASVATSGSYTDLSNKPSIPAAQVNSDWTSNSGVSQILNKPNLSTVATSGDYNDLINKPTVPGGQVQSDWAQNDTTNIAYIQHKPVEKVLVAGTNVTFTEDTTSVTISASGGPVDQTYNSSSSNPQSGTAVAGAIATVRQVPSSTSSDNGKVLGVVDSSGNIGWTRKADLVAGATAGDLAALDCEGNLIDSGIDYNSIAAYPSMANNAGKVLAVNSGETGVEWVSQSNTYTAGNMVSISNNAIGVSTTAGITDIQLVSALPANPVSTVLYLIQET